MKTQIKNKVEVFVVSTGVNNLNVLSEKDKSFGNFIKLELTFPISFISSIRKKSEELKSGCKEFVAKFKIQEMNESIWFTISILKESYGDVMMEISKETSSNFGFFRKQVQPVFCQSKRI